MRRLLLAASCRSATLAAALGLAGPTLAWSPRELLSPCRGDCAVAVFVGPYVQTGMGEILLNGSPPTHWDYNRDYLLGAAASRRTGRLWIFDVEPEAGIGRRFGGQDETELWGALYFRYRGFPWDGKLVTTAAFSTGLNWASDVSGVERERAHDGQGSPWMHYFAPEMTFALPSRPETELLIRFHHRSGVFGLVNDAFGGAQYLTVGLRLRF